MFFGIQLFEGGTQLLVQMVFLLFMIYLGIMRGGVSLGLIGGFGTLILFFVFGAKPATPPVEVIFIILSVILASSTLQAVGGMDYMVQIAERILRKHPKYVSVIAPFVTYFFTMLIGTGHGIYALQPVIFDVAYNTGVRPERPMAASAVSSQMGITASPISAALMGVVTFLGKGGAEYKFITVPNVLMITIPATFIGVVMIAIYSFNRGKELKDDTEFQERMKDEGFRKTLESSGASALNATIATKSKVSVGIFLMAIVAVVILAIWGKAIMPAFGDPPKPPSMGVVLQLVMLGTGAIIVFYTGVHAKKISDTNVFNAGMIAIATIYGIATMSETVVGANKAYLETTIKAITASYPFLFALAMFAVSAFVKSQGACIAIMVPLGITLGLPVEVILGAVPACYAYFFFCFYPSDLAAINFDRTGTTRIGKYLLNHSFMLPGLIGVGTACVVSYFLARFVVSYIKPVAEVTQSLLGG